MAVLDDYYVSQIKETLEFDLKLIERMLDYPDDMPGLERIKLDLEAVRFDIGIALDMLNAKSTC